MLLKVLILNFDSHNNTTSDRQLDLYGDFLLVFRFLASENMETPRRVLRNRNLDNVASQFTPVKIPATPLLKRLGYGTGVNVYQLDRSPRNGKMMSPWALKRVSKKITQNNGEIYETRIKEEAEILRYFFFFKLY